MLPHCITDIGDRAFFKCGNLSGRLVIPNSVTNIGWEAFHNCGAFTELILSTNVTNIGEGAFLECNGLTKVISVCPSKACFRRGRGLRRTPATSRRLERTSMAA